MVGCYSSECLCIWSLTYRATHVANSGSISSEYIRRCFVGNVIDNEEENRWRMRDNNSDRKRDEMRKEIYIGRNNSSHYLPPTIMFDATFAWVMDTRELHRSFSFYMQILFFLLLFPIIPIFPEQKNFGHPIPSPITLSGEVNTFENSLHIFSRFFEWFFFSLNIDNIFLHFSLFVFAELGVESLSRLLIYFSCKYIH